MQTAMQELIDYVNEIWSNAGWEESIKDKATQLLEKEKEQIIDALIHGGEDLDLYGDDSYKIGEGYYNQTYKQYGLDDETRNLLNQIQ